jgi:heavy metal sensor kinase
VKRWWHKRSLKLRLALWYALTTALVLTISAVLMDQLVEHWLRAETDRQLRIDFDVIEPQLETNETGELRYLPRGAHGDEGFARLLTWFEIWSEDKQLLLRHWPVPEEQIHSSLEAPPTNILRFQTTELEPGLFVRLMERPARIDRRGVIVRVFRDETEMRRTLRNIIEVSALGVPLAIVLASLGGYFIAGRSLAPMGAIVKQARRITSESLEQRLPNENPHDELGQLVTIFNETLERLENSFTELKRFTSDASHELRTPLTALRAVGEVALRDRSQAEALRETVASMLEEAERLDDLVEALLTLARGESREFSPKLESVRVGDIVNEVREEIAILATEKQQTISVSGEEGLTAWADRSLLRQALLNILFNAVHYSPVGSAIRMGCCRESNGVSITVADEGPGIEAEYRTRIFERFFRVDKARSRTEGGAGLGLAIAKMSIERQGGRIEVQSELGHGSIFRIALRAATGKSSETLK